jgi:hypothetical protein
VKPLFRYIIWLPILPLTSKHSDRSICIRCHRFTGRVPPHKRGKSKRITTQPKNLGFDVQLIILSLWRRWRRVGMGWGGDGDGRRCPGRWGRRWRGTGDGGGSRLLGLLFLALLCGGPCQDGGVVGGEQEHWRPRPAAYKGQVTAAPDSLRQMKVRAPWP